MDRRTSSNKAKYRHQVAAGRYALLAVAGFTLVNLLLMFKANYHFLLSAAVPYYVNWLCAKMELAGIWPVLAGLLAVALEGFFCVCWVQSYRRRIYLTAALAGYALDTLLLMIFAFTLVENPASCILEILTHIGVLGLLAVAEQAAGVLHRMRRRPRTMEPV